MEWLKKIFNIQKRRNFALRNVHLKFEVLGIKFSFKISENKHNYTKFEKCIGIFCGGGIGDYLLLRNNLRAIKESCKENKIIFFAKNESLKQLAVNYDNSVIDKVMLLSDVKLSHLRKYYDFETLINFAPFYNLCKDTPNDKKTHNIIKSIKANKKIGSIIGSKNSTQIKKFMKIYTDFVYTPLGIFEEQRFKTIAESALDIKYELNKNILKPIWDINKNYVLISPFSRTQARNISDDMWIKITNYLLEVLKDVNVVFIGNKFDSIYIQSIINRCNKSDNIVDLSGKTDITLLPSIIQKSLFLISPDTGTVHFANAMAKKAICISCGAYYNRFQPYQENMIYVYPDKFDEIISENNQQELLKYYNNDYSLDIKNISFEKIKINIDKMINNLIME